MLPAPETMRPPTGWLVAPKAPPQAGSSHDGAADAAACVGFAVTDGPACASGTMIKDIAATMVLRFNSAAPPA
jgi:hypothetical protein